MKGKLRIDPLRYAELIADLEYAFNDDTLPTSELGEEFKTLIGPYMEIDNEEVELTGIEALEYLLVTAIDKLTLIANHLEPRYEVTDTGPK